MLAAGDDGIVRKKEDHHPYAGITMAEWSAANCRLMAHLLQTNILPKDHLEYYFTYTTNIYEYATQYEWDAFLD